MQGESADKVRARVLELSAVLSEERLRALLHYVEYLAHWEEQEAWSRFGAPEPREGLQRRRA